MQRTARRSKRPRLPEQFPSSASVEYISVTREDNGRITKKQVFEKAKFDTRPAIDARRAVNARAAFDAVTNFDGPFPPPDVDSPQDIADGPTEPGHGAMSRAVSVSVVFFHHANNYSFRIGQALQMDPASPGVPQ